MYSCSHYYIIKTMQLREELTLYIHELKILNCVVMNYREPTKEEASRKEYWTTLFRCVVKTSLSCDNDETLYMFNKVIKYITRFRNLVALEIVSRLDIKFKNMILIYFTIRIIRRQRLNNEIEDQKEEGNKYNKTNNISKQRRARKQRRYTKVSKLCLCEEDGSI